MRTSGAPYAWNGTWTANRDPEPTPTCIPLEKKITPRFQVSEPSISAQPPLKEYPARPVSPLRPGTAVLQDDVVRPVSPLQTAPARFQEQALYGGTNDPQVR
jgi:hypothetical protein